MTQNMFPPFWHNLIFAAILFHQLAHVCVLHLICDYIVISSYHNSNLFISSTIVHLTYFIDHSPSLSYLPYLVIPMLYVTRPYFHVRLRNQILIKYIHSWADIKTYGSKPNFTNITCSARQSKNFGSSDQAIP